MPRLSGSEQGRFTNLYAEVLVVLTDKMSMVSNICLWHIHKRLCEIFGCSQPIKAPQIFEPSNNGFGYFFNLWLLFVMAELTKVMQQKGDENFVNILNNFCVGQCSEDNVKQLEMRKSTYQKIHILMPPYCLLKIVCQKMILMLAK